MGTRIGFIGIRPSPKCQPGQGWQDYILCARPLHDALRACGIDPRECTFVNLVDTPCAQHTLPSRRQVARRKAKILEALRECDLIVALGRTTFQFVKDWFPDRDLRLAVHPAARGTIRRREQYIRHIKEVLHLKEQPNQKSKRRKSL